MAFDDADAAAEILRHDVPTLSDIDYHALMTFSAKKPSSYFAFFGAGREVPVTSSRRRPSISSMPPRRNTVSTYHYLPAVAFTSFLSAVAGDSCRVSMFCRRVFMGPIIAGRKEPTAQHISRAQRRT